MTYEKTSTIGQRIKLWLDKNKMSQADLLRVMQPYLDRYNQKLSSGQLSLYCNDANEPKQSLFFLMAQAMGVSEAWLMGYDVPMKTTPENAVSVNVKGKVPLVGTIACGTPTLAEQNIEDYIPVMDGVDADMAIRCHGDSMKDAGILDGDIAFIKIQPFADNGTVVAVQIGEEATLKKFSFDGKELVLSPANPVYDPLVYTGRELMDVKILGKLVGISRRF